MIKILPKMSSQRLDVKDRLMQGQKGGGGPGGGGGHRERHLRTELKRRSSELMTSSADSMEKATGAASKRMRRPSEGGNWKQHRRLRKHRKRTTTLTNNAPFNSTQFLMSDHGGDTIQYLDSTLGVAKGSSRPSSERVVGAELRRVTRARESSFSLDSDEDFYYSSPEDEEEFVSQEFMKEYNRMKECVRTDRLSDMSKADLIQEYLQMEQRVDTLEKRLSRHKDKTEDHAEGGTDSSSTCSDSKETAEQIRLFQREILRLESENERLRSANVYLQQKKILKKGETVNGPTMEDQEDDGNTSCSTCSSSSSSSSDSSDDSSDSENEGEEAPPPPPPPATLPPPVPLPIKEADLATVPYVDQGKPAENDRDDTGYESSHSGSTNNTKQQPTSGPEDKDKTAEVETTTS